MAALKLKTLEEHCGMVEKMGRLSFCFASRRLKERTNFLHFSPQEWQDDLPSRREEETVPEWHFGWWGQWITAHGTIDPETDKFVRKNGFLRYAFRSPHCLLENMRRHLKEKSCYMGEN